MIWAIYGAVAALLVVLPFIRFVFSIYPEYLWFLDLGYASVFLSTWGYRLLYSGIAALAAFLFIYINLRIALWARKRMASEPQVIIGDHDTPDYLDQFSAYFRPLERGFLIPLIASLLIGLGFGLFWFVRWDIVALAIHAQSFGIADPLFNKDVGFYMFQLPLLQAALGWARSLLVLTLIAIGVLYATRRAISFAGFKVHIRSDIKIHVSVLLALFFLLLTLSYRLGMFSLLFNDKGLMYGAGFTDVHADLMGYKALMFISIVIAGLFFVNLFRNGILLPLEGIGVLVVVFVLMKGVYPVALQQLIVKPNEMEKERPYIHNHIQMTRSAYGLNKVNETVFTINATLTPQSLERNQDMFANIRLWDPRPLLKTLEQLQEIRLYYGFNDVDVDRYTIAGKPQQVMLAARELDSDQLPDQARNWINQKLTYTHGHGLVVLPVNKMSEEGLPEFYTYDIPPKTIKDMPVKEAGVYFGESTNKYVIINTKVKEFDYPQGDANQYSVYNGPQGVMLSSIWRRLLFAIKYQEINFLLSNALTSKSKVLFDRNILLRAKKIAPFLSYDGDPYLVLVKGKMYWILDSYIVGSQYPYAKPFSGSYNYIRNAVKVVVDAYSGETRFVINDPHEPFIKAYASIFPSLFTPVTAIDPEIRAHFRYPEDLFLIQSKMFGTYHMTDPQVFYNQEDLWVVPQETVGETATPMEPYYAMLKLPEDKGLTFRLMLPFTPSKKNNMIGWLSANSDPDAYGTLTAYKLPKEQMVYGPMQIESRIDQDTEISKQLTLWGQKGSTVIRGNLLVIPVDQSFLYVEPLYLQATSSRFPELKRIIVAYGNKVAMEPTFEAALRKVFDGGAFELRPTTGPAASSTPADSNAKVRQLAAEANTLYLQAQQAVQALDWNAYGDYTRRLGDVLKEMRR